MTLPERRLEELDRISRERSLTDGEQREVIKWAGQLRQYRRDRLRYASNQEFRERRIAKSREYRRTHPGYSVGRWARRMEAAE